MSEATPVFKAGLSVRDAAILDFEVAWWESGGEKDAEIRDRFDLSAPRYYQILNQLIDTPEALMYQPLLVKRLRRLRQLRQENRSARHLTVRANV